MKSFWEICAPYRGRILWTAAGVLLALSLLWLGVWRTLLIAALGAVGYGLGFRGDEPERFSEIVDAIAQRIKKN